MGKSTISMAIFNSYVKLPEGRSDIDLIYRFDMGVMFDMDLTWFDME